MAWKRKGKPDGKCSICGKDFASFGFNAHNRYKHDDKAVLIPFTLESRIKEPPTITKTDELIEAEKKLPFEPPKEVHSEVTGWTAKTAGVSIPYRPIPIAQVIINQLKHSGKSSDDVINAALLYYAKSLGFEPAMITTTGGQQFKLLGESQDQKVVDNMVKIAQAESNIRRSESELNPVLLAASEDDGFDMTEMMKLMMMMKMFGED